MVTNTVEEVSEHPLRITSKMSVPAELQGSPFSGPAMDLVGNRGEVTPLNLFTGKWARRCDSRGAVRIAAGFGSLWVTDDERTYRGASQRQRCRANDHCHQSGDRSHWRDHGRRLVWVANAVGARWSE